MQQIIVYRDQSARAHFQRYHLLPLTLESYDGLSEEKCTCVHISHKMYERCKHDDSPRHSGSQVGSLE